MQFVRLTGINEFLRNGPKRKKNHYDWRKLTNYTFPIGQKIEVLKSGQANGWFWLDFRAAMNSLTPRPSHWTTLSPKFSKSFPIFCHFSASFGFVTWYLFSCCCFWWRHFAIISFFRWNSTKYGQLRVCDPLPTPPSLKLQMIPLLIGLRVVALHSIITFLFISMVGFLKVEKTTHHRQFPLP